jgi:hypothetical protein
MPADGIIDSVDFGIAAANGTGYSASIWTNNAGSPGTRLGSQGTEASVATTGTKTSIVTAPTLTAGTQYWIVLERTGGGTGDVQTSSAATGNGVFDRMGRGNTITAITNNLSSGNQWPRIDFNYTAADQSMTLVSDSFVADTAPVSARAVLLVDPQEAITLNTDLICEISRDDGTTWTAGTLEYEADYDANVQILATGEIDLTGQPSGTDVRIRVRTPTSKSVRVHAWTVQWR